MAPLHFHIEPMFLSASPGACKSGKKQQHSHNKWEGVAREKENTHDKWEGWPGTALSRTGAGRRARRAVCCEQPRGRAVGYLGKPAVSGQLF